MLRSVHEIFVLHQSKLGRGGGVGLAMHASSFFLSTRDYKIFGDFLLPFFSSFLFFFTFPTFSSS